MAKEQEKQEQPVPKVSPKRDEDSNDGDDDDDDDEGCMPCLACWQIVGIVVCVVCIVIGIAVAAVVLLVLGGDDDEGSGLRGGSGGGGAGGGKVSFPPDTLFKVEVENQYSHGSFGTGTYAVTFANMKEGQTDKEDATPTTTDIRAFFRTEEYGLARFEVTVVIDFDVDGSVDCRDTFYPSVDIDSGDFGEWSSAKTCTYTLGGIYSHSARVKVSSV